MIALVDCNNFYASCERLFNPKLKHKPVVVLSNNDGCVIARSDEAKNLGIKMGTPAFMFEDFFKKNDVQVFSSNYTLYGSLSDRVHQLLMEFAERVEIYSIDEAFLFLGDFGYTNLEKLAIKIKRTVKRNIGIPVSVGIAPTKTLAKMANRFAKKTNKEVGVHVLDSPFKINEVLAFTEVGDIWGVGPQYAKLLKRNGFTTAADFLNIPEEWIRKNMSVVGQRTLNELRGIPSIEFEEIIPARKNICVGRGFGKLLTEKKDIQEALSNYTGLVAKKLRQEKLCTSLIRVFLQTNIHRTEDKQMFSSINMELPVSTNSSFELITYAIQALDKLYKEDYNFNKVGCIAMNLVPEDQVQLGLFDSKNRNKDEKVMDAIDKLNRHFGTDLVKVARQGFSKKWKLRQLHLSKCYTTRIEDIQKVTV